MLYLLSIFGERGTRGQGGSLFIVHTFLLLETIEMSLLFSISVDACSQHGTLLCNTILLFVYFNILYPSQRYTIDPSLLRIVRNWLKIA